MPTFWFNAGKLVVDGSGHPIDCEDCPCGDEINPGCCEGYTYPTTIYATYYNVSGAGGCPAELEGLTVPMVWDGVVWTHTHTFTGSPTTTIQSRLLCGFGDLDFLSTMVIAGAVGFCTGGISEDVPCPTPISETFTGRTITTGNDGSGFPCSGCTSITFDVDVFQ